MITKSLQKNFDTLVRACRNGDVCLIECKDAMTKKPVMTVCAVNRLKNDMIDTVPVAKLFDGNPYEELISPLEV